MIDLMLHDPMEHVIERVMCALFARNQLIEPRIRHSGNRCHQFFMGSPHLRLCPLPGRLTGIANRRKIFRLRRLMRASTHPPPHRVIPSRNMQC